MHTADWTLNSWFKTLNPLDSSVNLLQQNQLPVPASDWCTLKQQREHKASRPSHMQLCSNRSPTASRTFLRHFNFYAAARQSVLPLLLLIRSHDVGSLVFFKSQL